MNITIATLVIPDDRPLRFGVLPFTKVASFLPGELAMSNAKITIIGSTPRGTIDKDIKEAKHYIILHYHPKIIIRPLHKRYIKRIREIVNGADVLPNPINTEKGLVSPLKYYTLWSQGLKTGKINFDEFDFSYIYYHFLNGNPEYAETFQDGKADFTLSFKVIDYFFKEMGIRCQSPIEQKYAEWFQKTYYKEVVERKQKRLETQPLPKTGLIDKVWNFLKIA